VILSCSNERALLYLSAEKVGMGVGVLGTLLADKNDDFHDLLRRHF
jgi:hypothetical protein